MRRCIRSPVSIRALVIVASGAPHLRGRDGVDPLPHATFNGLDEQLDYAIRHLLEAIERDPREVPPAPPYPNRAFDYTASTSNQEG